MGGPYDRFFEYSKLIKGMLRFHNSAPHHYWGLHFFHFNRVRERCQLGHAALTQTNMHSCKRQQKMLGDFAVYLNCKG